MTNFLPFSFINFEFFGKLALFLAIFALTRILLNLKQKKGSGMQAEKLLVKLGDETAGFTINLHLVISLVLAFALIAVKFLDQYIHF